MDPEVSAALIGPVITAALAASAVGLQEWRTRRRSADDREDSLERALKEVAFIDAWLSATAKIDAASDRPQHTQRALADLDRAYGVMAAVQASAASAPPRRTLTDRLRSILLLRLTRTRAKVARVGYFVFLIAAVFLLLATMATGIDVTQGLLFSILVFMLVTLFVFLPAFILYWVARLLDRPPPARPAPPPPPTWTGAYPDPPNASWGYGAYPAPPQIQSPPPPSYSVPGPPG